MKNLKTGVAEVFGGGLICAITPPSVCIAVSRCTYLWFRPLVHTDFGQNGHFYTQNGPKRALFGQNGHFLYFLDRIAVSYILLWKPFKPLGFSETGEKGRFWSFLPKVVIIVRGI